MRRASGILLPLFSLPSKSGRGDMGPEAYRFIDKLSEAGQRYWQVLPLGPVNETNCPYQSTSAFAGEASFISLEKLVETGYLKGEDADLPKEEALARAWEKGCRDERFLDFCREEEAWLEDYALYSALSDRFGKDWSCWEEDISRADEKAKERWREELSEEVDRHRWTQFLFFDQWERILAYAHGKGIDIIGDLPYFVSYESADCWAHRELFRIGEDGRQQVTAGVPPDYFTPEGQCWDNPLYDWQANKEQGYDWWIRRIGQQLRYFDMLRIDHMRGFESYYAISYETKDPKDGEWEKGPDMDLLGAVNRAFGKERFIAEDLGTLTEEVHRLIDDSGYPGMKVLQFAFDTGEENIYLPSNYEDENCVVYTGTHDNDTTLGWYEKAEDWKKQFLTWYLKDRSETSFAGVDRGEEIDAEDAVRGMIELAHSSRAMLSIIPMQDYLKLGSEARTNRPGVRDGNWCWQMDADAFDEGLIEEIAAMCSAYGR